MPYEKIRTTTQAPAAAGAPWVLWTRFHLRPNAQLPDNLQGVIELRQAFMLVAVQIAFDPRCLTDDLFTVLNWYQLTIHRGPRLELSISLLQIPLSTALPWHKHNTDAAPAGAPGAGLHFTAGECIRTVLTHNRTSREQVPYLRQRRHRGAGVDLSVCLWMLPPEPATAAQAFASRSTPAPAPQTAAKTRRRSSALCVPMSPRKNGLLPANT